MAISEQLRSGLTDEGPGLELSAAPDQARAGEQIPLTVQLTGGREASQVQALVLRLLRGTRHWVDGTGKSISEEEAHMLPNPRSLTPRWDRDSVHEVREEVLRSLEPSESSSIELTLGVPESCGPTTEARNYLLHVRAEVRGRIDPVAYMRLLVR